MNTKKQGVGWLHLCGASIAAVCGCSLEAPSTEPVGQVAHAFTNLTPVEQLTPAGWRSRAIGNYHHVGVAGGDWSGFFSSTRYVVLFNDYDYDLYYFIVDAEPGSFQYGKRVTGPTQVTDCSAGPPCTGYPLDACGATWQRSSFLHSVDRRPVFVFPDIWASDTSTDFWGYVRVHGLEFNSKGGYRHYDLFDCVDPQHPDVPECLFRAPTAAGALGGAGGRPVMVTALVSERFDVNDWDLVSFLWQPGHAVQELGSVHACGEPPCSIGDGHTWTAKTAVGFNAQRAKFLAVSVIWPNSGGATPYIMGKIYDINGFAGPTVDLGVPADDPFNDDTDDSVGVASDPDHVRNPDQRWVVFVGSQRFHVWDDGSYASGTIDPNEPGHGNWTLHWTSATSDEFEYERLVDSDHTYRVHATRYASGFAAGDRFNVSELQGETFVEGLAHVASANNTLALWSYAEDSQSIFQWRLIDH